MKRDKLQKIILGLLVVAILGYCYYAFYLQGQINNVSKLRGSIKQVKENIHNLKIRKATIDGDIAKAKEQSEKVDEAMPDTYDSKIIIAYFYNLIKEKGLTGDKINLTESTANTQGYKIETATMKVVGDYDSVRSFIKEIEQDKRKFVFKQTMLVQNDKGTFDLTFTVEFYSLK